LKKKYKILLAALIMVYPLYKGARELFWVTHQSIAVNQTLHIAVRMDPDIFGFQDYNYDKTITVTNTATKASLKISFVSIEPNLYFYTDSAATTFSIADQYAGMNTYDYATLKLVSNADCFSEFGGCGGYSDSNRLKPVLIFDNKGLHK
jgi:hypothetical protein